MAEYINITDGEHAVMKVLWDKGVATMPEILDCLPGQRGTQKTLLIRLIQKGAIVSEENKARFNTYTPAVSEEEYIANARKLFLQKVFDGSAERMLLNFVKEENISAESLKRLAQLIEEDNS